LPPLEDRRSRSHFTILSRCQPGANGSCNTTLHVTRPRGPTSTPFGYSRGVNACLLSGKIALVTGAAAGIGESIAHLFAEHGASVYALDIDLAGVDRVARAIQSEGGSAWAQEADVRRTDMLQSVIEDVIRRSGRIDILVNNAGIYPRRAFLDVTDQEWDEIQDINLKGVYRCMKLVLPYMVAKRSGKVINISSVTFLKGLANLSHYIASKGGVIGLTRAVAREMGPHDIHINCIMPGAIEVEREKEVATPEQMAAIVAQQSLERRLVPIDIARVCVFLASELSDGMTGQTVNVDGGLMMY
jgi:3-oxoacyl-[acyl-carrier protein] reductase